MIWLRTNFLITPFLISLLVLGNFAFILLEQVEDPSDFPAYVEFSFEKDILLFLQHLFYHKPSLEDCELPLTLWKEKKSSVRQPYLPKKFMAFKNLVGGFVPMVILSTNLNIPPFPPPRLVMSSISSNTCNIIRKIPSPDVIF